MISTIDNNCGLECCSKLHMGGIRSFAPFFKCMTLGIFCSLVELQKVMWAVTVAVLWNTNLCMVRTKNGT